MLNSGPVIWVLSVFACPYRRVIFSVVVVTSLHYAAQLGPASAVVQFRSPQHMQSIAYSVVVSTSLFKCDIVLYVVKKSTCTLTCPGICPRRYILFYSFFVRRPTVFRISLLIIMIIITRGQSNLTKSASGEAHSPVRGHPRGSKVVPLNSWGRVSY